MRGQRGSAHPMRIDDAVARIAMRGPYVICRVADTVIRRG
jgi:hypothetical protein